MNQKTLGFVAVLALSAPMSGCLTEGELGGGSFGYICAAAGDDAACDGAFVGEERTLPRKIAVGASFSVDFHGDGASPSAFLPESASSEVLLPVGGTFLFQKPQFGAILARDTAGRIGDFIHLTGVDVDQLVVSSSSSSTNELKLQVGDTRTLYVFPIDGTGETLAGGFTYTWTVKGADGVVDVVNDEDLGGSPKSNTVIVTGVAAGSVDVAVQAKDKIATVHVTVGG